MPGSAPLTLPTADANNVEINQPDDLLVAKMVALALVEKKLYGKGREQQVQWGQWMARMQRDIDVLKRGKGSGNAHAVTMPRWV